MSKTLAETVAGLVMDLEVTHDDLEKKTRDSDALRVAVGELENIFATLPKAL